MKVYQFISSRMEGNTYLRKRQYEYESNELALFLVKNKILNQMAALKKIRNQNELLREALGNLQKYLNALEESQPDISIQEVMGIEGIASRVYFGAFFDMVNWKGRKARIKNDYINASLDIGYTILFNIADALLNCYGFDEYYGVLHRCFYMRKSLVCDIMEPLRPIIDYELRKAINLKQIKKEDFEVYNFKYVLGWKKSPDYVRIFLDAILNYREEIFLYMQSYYRAFMKQRPIEDFSMFLLKG